MSRREYGVVPADVAAAAREADGKREAAAMESKAAERGARLAEAHGDPSTAKKLSERWRAAEARGLEEAAAIGRLVHRPGPGKKSVKPNKTEEPRSGTIEAPVVTAKGLAAEVGLSAATVDRFSCASFVYDQHRSRWDAYLAQQRAALKRASIDDLANIGRQLMAPKERSRKPRTVSPKVRGAKLLDRTAAKLRELAQGEDDTAGFDEAVEALERAARLLRGESEPAAPELGEPYGEPYGGAP